MNKQAIIEAVKEALRIAVLGAIGALIAWLTQLEPSVTVTVTLLVLRSIDKYIHKSPSNANGLLPF